MVTLILLDYLNNEDLKFVKVYLIAQSVDSEKSV